MEANKNTHQYKPDASFENAVALIFENYFFVTTFFRNFGIQNAEVTPSRKKKQILFCSSLDFP